jgi:hypothetical protein
MPTSGGCRENSSGKCAVASLQIFAGRAAISSHAVQLESRGTRLEAPTSISVGSTFSKDMMENDPELVVENVITSIPTACSNRTMR